MKNLPSFIILALLILPATALAVPVSFTGSVDYEGNIAAGHVISAVSATGTTSKTIYASSFLLNHLGNEGETVAFYFEGMKGGRRRSRFPDREEIWGTLRARNRQHNIIFTVC
jgi:metal-dependent amidase/aminoacylase/carboxypeptidase family protein